MSPKLLSESEVPAAVDELRRLLGDDLPAEPGVSRRRLQALLTERSPGSVPADAWPLLDALWSFEAQWRPVVRAADLPRVSPAGWASRVSLWRGDITTLEIGGIVNAANAGLTGCYRPFHACVDNAIHTAAGPRLREECGAIMAGRGRPEPTATATATAGHFLPARHVVHTVGPIVEGGAPSGDDEALLRRCYSASLEAARGIGSGGLAFCSISTGVFGYPIRLAAPVALAAVRDFLERDESFEQVVLVTYSESDQAVYAAATKEACRAS
jgi:O-acetyl-ADP-ribose deacetylase (regulator of RNase III)